MDRKQDTIKGVDWVLIILYLVLIIMGWLNIYAANYDIDHTSIFDNSKEYGKQFIWICISLVMGLTILKINSSFFKDFAFIIYIAICLLLVAVLIFGKEVHGAKSWFGVGSFGIQPSEFSKIGVSLALAAFVSSVRLNKLTGVTKLSVLLKAIVIIVIPAILILLQPDVGTLLVYVAFILVLYREGITGNIVLYGISILVLAIATLSLINYQVSMFQDKLVISGISMLVMVIISIALLLYFIMKNYVLPRYRKKNLRHLVIVTISSLFMVGLISFVYNSDKILKVHHKTRIDILFGHKEDPSGAGYNVNQALTAIGSGGVTGKGYLKGVLTKYKYVPEQSTDFIFCTVGEEWGFVGSTLVVLLIMSLIFRLIIVAERQKSIFNRVFGYSVATILFMHITINVGMAIGVVPVIGIPLPFFSYGGSSLFAFTFLLFIMIKLDGDRMKSL